ncbi:hypothetical protein BegalDRAFT_0079 [Beggiatoa alba B18LD]|uniref:Novel STAND NTPase 1 domain-containing protein n=1 Tax=Beggiatoa alba B18LD TaxID=395493 RepID=I3CBL0_9GAMM|nr:hypothetical protein [Beggiatoa alba]EIJ41003.1 hypothetical protein BegalDRAFT_0079 [Beggiatoa alba B18LD]
MRNSTYIQSTYLAQDTLRLIGRYGQVTIFQQYSSLADRKTQTQKETNPFRGLSTFYAQNNAQFFGRESLLDKLWERLLSFYGEDVNPLTLRVLPIIGPSGVGKSSLIQAGLLPQLVNQRYLPFRRVWTAVMKPSVHPLKNLASALAGLYQCVTTERIDKNTQFFQQLQHKQGLSKLLQTFPEAATSPVFLVVEQLEELYTHCQDESERNLFIDNLLMAAADPQLSFTLVLTLRTDFLAMTQHHHLLYQTLATQSILVPMLTKSQLLQVINEPLAGSSTQWNVATVEELIQQTRHHAESLPLLQFTLYRLWHYKQQGMSEIQALKLLGNTLQDSVSAEAERLYQSLSNREKSTARAVFLKLLIIDEQGVYPRRVSQESLINLTDTSATVEAVLTAFTQTESRLLTVNKAHGHTFVELTHAILLTHWARLVRWISASQRDVFFQHRFAEAVKQWDKEKRTASLLWRSTDLALLRQYYARASHEFSTIQEAFFIESDQRQRYFSRLKRWFFASLAVLSLSALLGIYEKGKTIEEVENQLSLAWENVELAQAERDKAIAAEQKAKAAHNYSFFPDNIYAPQTGLLLAGSETAQPVIDPTTDNWLSDEQLMQARLKTVASVALELPSPPKNSIEKNYVPTTTPIIVLETGETIDPLKEFPTDKSYIIVHADETKKTAKPETTRPKKPKLRIVPKPVNKPIVTLASEEADLFGAPVHYQTISPSKAESHQTSAPQTATTASNIRQKPIKQMTVSSNTDTNVVKNKPSLTVPKNKEGFLF